jgi:hypothetical protein
MLSGWPNGGQRRPGIKAHPHVLRRACGYALANKGPDTRAIQGLARKRRLGPITGQITFRIGGDDLGPRATVGAEVFSARPRGSAKASSPRHHQTRGSLAAAFYGRVAVKLHAR